MKSRLQDNNTDGEVEDPSVYDLKSSSPVRHGLRLCYQPQVRWANCG